MVTVAANLLVPGVERLSEVADEGMFSFAFTE